MKVEEQASSWVFITPISNLELTDSVQNEFQIDRVTFISSNKLQRIRDRLGIKKKYIQDISIKLKNSGCLTVDEYLSQYKTFAVLRESGKPKEIKTKCYRRIQEELLILALSQLYFQNRRYTGFIGIAGEHDQSFSTHIFLDSQKASFIKTTQALRSQHKLILDQEWVDYHKNFFFFRLLKILNGKIQISPKWQREFRRAIILVGKSINSNHLADSFLWNMIALELMLTHQGDTYAIALPERIQALIGWCPVWSSDNYYDKIGQAYKLRCHYIHDGDSSKISKADLLFTDTLIFNVIWNLTAFSKIFGSKNDLINFSDKAKARQLLNIRHPKIPKLKFTDLQYSEDDLLEV